MSLSRVRAVFFRYLYILFKGGHSLVDLLYWPFVDILLWGLTSVWIQTQHNASELPLILMTGLIFWHVTWRGSIDISANLVQEFWNRNLVNLFSTPLKISEWGCGVIILSVCKLAITLSFGSFLVYLLHSLNVFTLGWIFLPFVVALIIFGWAIGFLSAGFIIYWGHRVEMLAWTIPYVFAPFSAVFYPVSILPKFVQQVAWCLPTTYIFEGMRSIISQGSFPTHYFWKSLALDFVYLIGAFCFFNFMFSKSLTKGLSRLE